MIINNNIEIKNIEILEHKSIKILIYIKAEMLISRIIRIKTKKEILRINKIK